MGRGGASFRGGNPMGNMGRGGGMGGGMMNPNVGLAMGMGNMGNMAMGGLAMGGMMGMSPWAWVWEQVAATSWEEDEEPVVAEEEAWVEEV
jgi:hypothetical protein